MTNFNTWLTTYCEEADIDNERTFEIETESQVHFIPVGVVIEHAMIASTEEQAFIKDTVVKIDFHNGDVYHFFNHLATCIACVADGC